MRRQGSQFTSTGLIAVLKAAETAVSMDGRGAQAGDHVLVERLWRRVKCEEVRLHANTGVSAARPSIGRCLGVHNARSPRSSLGGRTPDQACRNQPTPTPAAA